jgi:uncharacterized protein (DUF305 family)
MMKDMSIKQNGNVDQDFEALMEPHHQSAIVMVQQVMREIFVDQDQEIPMMKIAPG